jgi:hypothetical protein
VALCAGFNVGQSLGASSVEDPGAAAGSFAIPLLSNFYAEGGLAFQTQAGSQSLDFTGSFWVGHAPTAAPSCRTA